MSPLRLCLALLLACAVTVAAVPAADADDFRETLAALRKAKTKEERLAVLKGKGDRQIESVVENLLDAERELRVRGEFAELESFHMWAEEAASLLNAPGLRERYQLACLYDRGRNEQAREQIDAAAKSYKAFLAAIARKPEYKAMRPFALTLLAGTQADQGDYLGGLRTAEEARVLLAALDDPQRAMAEPPLLGTLGRLHIELGDDTRAEKALGEAVKLAAKAGDPTTAPVARMQLAMLDVRRGRYAEAVRAYEGLLGEFRRGRNRIAEGAVLNNLGLALREYGRVGEALERFGEARRLAAALGHRRGEALALYNLAFLHCQLGGEDGPRYLRAARKLFDDVGDQVGVARCLKLSGIIHQDAGEAAEAEKAFAECLSLIKASGSKSEEAQLSLFVGRQYEEAGLTKKAREAYAAAVAAYRELGDPVRTALARLLKASVRQPDGPAFDLNELSDLKATVARLDDPHLTTLYHTILAEYRYRQGEPAASAGELRVAIKASERYLSAIEDPQFRVSAARDDVLHARLAAVLFTQGDFSGTFRACERSKARVLTGLLDRSRAPIEKGMTPDERQKERRAREEVTVAAGKCASQMRVANAEEGKAEALKEELEDAAARYTEFRHQVFRAHPELRGQRGELPEVDLTELHKGVFAREPGLAVLSYLVAFDRVMIAVVTAGDKPDGPARVVVKEVKVEEKELATAAENFWKACQNPKAGRPLSDGLYKWLIEPVEKDIAGKKHLLIVPCHPLLTVPFQALAADQDSPYLIEKFAISYAPSVSALLEMRKRGDRVRGPGRADQLQMLALGGAKFTPDLLDLPESGPEADAVGKTFGDRSRVLKAEQATRPEVLKHIASARFLHFATHGEINPPRPLFSALAVTPTGKEDDGRLYAHDVMSLNLTAELVVLSACDTGRGKEYRGEGTVGLAWAFFVAGTPAVVVSQWKVFDTATAELMREFYTRLRAGTDPSKAEALRQAALTLLKAEKTKHPMFWAPFVLIGDWQK